MSGQKADDLTMTCTAWTKTGDRCRKRAMRDGSGLCWTHSLTEEERKEHGRKMRKARAHKARVATEASENRLGITPDVTLDQILRVCTQALGAKFEHDGSPDHGARLTACAVLLNVFPRTLRATPEAARSLLHALLDGTRHEALADRETSDQFKALRREWYEVRTRCTDLGELYIEPVPAWMIPPGETRADVMRREAPDLTGYTVMDIAHKTHALAVAPDGTETLVHRDTPRLMADTR